MTNSKYYIVNKEPNPECNICNGRGVFIKEKIPISHDINHQLNLKLTKCSCTETRKYINDIEIENKI